jgi:O-antigen/teichoic acid export membrane protein
MNIHLAIDLRWLRSRRLRRRGLTVVATAANSLVVPAVSVLVSLLVVRLASAALWGALVEVMIVVQLAAHVIGWGNKDYLLRAFSTHPAAIAQAWQTSLVTRLALFAPLIVLAALLGQPSLRTLLALVWCLGLVLSQSCDVLILYRKDFVFSMAVELASVALLVALVLWRGASLTVDALVLAFALAAWLKTGAFFLRFRSGVLPRWAGHFFPGYFRLALMFFLLGLAGLLQSRVDLYAVAFYLPSVEVGHYQVFITLMLYLQAMAAFILMPFVKAIYRLDDRAIARLSVRLFALGGAIVVPGLVAVAVILRHLYRFPVPPDMLLFGGLMVLPVYGYAPIVYRLYKANRQASVLAITVLGLLTSLGLSVLLLPRMGMPGAVAASAAAQWLMLACYVVMGRTASQIEKRPPALTAHD